MSIDIDRESWEAGVRDGAAGTAAPDWSKGPSKERGHDSYSYNSGRIEGEAFRGGYEVTLDVARILGYSGPGFRRGN